MEALLPEVTDWETAISDQATKDAIPEYAKRRRGEPSAFTKQSASYITRYSTTWQEEAEPVLVSELKHKYSSQLLLRCGARMDVPPRRRGQPVRSHPLPHRRSPISVLEHNR